MRHEHAKDILGATCSVLEDKTKVWYVKMPELVELERDQPSLKTPLRRRLEDEVTNLSDYLDDPTDPVICVPEQDHDHYWRLLNSRPESALERTRVCRELLATVSAFGKADLGR